MAELLIGRALGYPLPAGNAEMQYHDMTECRELGVCHQSVAEYCCSDDPRDFDEIFAHIHAYHTVWALLGRNMTIDTDVHPRLAAAWRQMKEAALGTSAVVALLRVPLLAACLHVAPCCSSAMPDVLLLPSTKSYDAKSDVRPAILRWRRRRPGGSGQRRMC